MMSYEKLESIYIERGLLKFKLYSLTYVIEKTINGPVIYAETQEARKSLYSTFEQLMNSYTVYNESLMETLNKIQILN